MFTTYNVLDFTASGNTGFIVTSYMTYISLLVITTDKVVHKTYH